MYCQYATVYGCCVGVSVNAEFSAPLVLATLRHEPAWQFALVDVMPEPIEMDRGFGEGSSCESKL